MQKRFRRLGWRLRANQLLPFGRSHRNIIGDDGRRVELTPMSRPEFSAQFTRCSKIQRRSMIMLPIWARVVEFRPVALCSRDRRRVLASFRSHGGGPSFPRRPARRRGRDHHQLIPGRTDVHSASRSCAKLEHGPGDYRDHLAQAQRHLSMGEEVIARQRRVISRLERDGHDSGEARRLLALFEPRRRGSPFRAQYTQSPPTK